MKREFIFNIILLIVINLVVKPLYIFGIEARVQNIVGIASYGQYFDYLNFVFLFQFINDPGIQNWNAQYVPQNRQTIGLHLSSLIQVKSILAILFIIATYLFSYFIGYNDQHLILLLTISLILSTAFMYCRTTIAGLGYYRIDSLLSILDKGTMILIIGYFVWVSSFQTQFSIFDFVYCQIVAYFISFIIAATILSSKVQWVYRKISLDYFIKILKWSAPYVLILVFMTAYNKLDGVMLGRLLDDNNYQAGVYATAYRFYDASNMIGYLFAALLLPMFSAHATEPKMLQDLKEIGLKLVILTSTIIILTLLFYGDKMLDILFDYYDPATVNVLKILMISYMFVAISYIYGTLLVGVGKVKLLNVVFGIGLLLNVILNILLIPRYQAIGAAIATFGTQIFVMFGQIFLVKKELKLDVPKRDLLNLSGFVLFSFGGFYILNTNLLNGWYIILGLSILICLLLSFIFKIIDKKEVISLLRRE